VQLVAPTAIFVHPPTGEPPLSILNGPVPPVQLNEAEVPLGLALKFERAGEALIFVVLLELYKTLSTTVALTTWLPPVVGV
jgi:hypothetical protein